MMFRKFIVGSMLAFCAAASIAAQIDTSGLTDAQVAELRAHAATAAANNAKESDTSKTPSIATATTVATFASTFGTQMATAAEGFAKALNIAAKELGITINDFLNTPAGKLTAILIIWKVAGAAAVKMLYGVLFVTVGLSMVRMMYLRLFTKGYEKVSYSYFGLIKGEKMVRVPKTFKDLDNEGEWLAFWVIIIATIATIGFGGIFF